MPSTLRPSTSRIAVLVPLIVVAMIVAACDPSQEDVPEPRSGGTASSSELEHAPWKIAIRLAPGHGKLSKKRSNRIKKSAAPVESLVVEVYDALFLAPDNRRTVITKRFLPPSAKALLKTTSGVPVEAFGVRMLRRTATIAIDAGTGRLAVARVTVKARGTNGARRFTVRHDARLWLEKAKGRWKVIAFRVDQEPSR